MKKGSHVNQQKMQQSLADYNEMFGTKFELSQIQSYNGNLNKRLARKDAKFASRNEQLDLVIVVDRLLTGFDAPCMSTILLIWQPMGPAMISYRHFPERTAFLIRIKHMVRL